LASNKANPSVPHPGAVFVQGTERVILWPGWSVASWKLDLMVAAEEAVAAAFAGPTLASKHTTVSEKNAFKLILLIFINDLFD
jgi:hypothetical protein